MESERNSIMPLTEKQEGHILALLGDLRIANEKLVTALNKLQTEKIDADNRAAEAERRLLECIKVNESFAQENESQRKTIEMLRVINKDE